MVLLHWQFIFSGSTRESRCSTHGSDSHVYANERRLRAYVTRRVSFGGVHNLRRFADEPSVDERGTMLSDFLAAQTEATSTTDTTKDFHLVLDHMGRSLSPCLSWNNSGKGDKVVFNISSDRTGRLLRRHINQLWNTLYENEGAF